MQTLPIVLNKSAMMLNMNMIFLSQRYLSRGEIYKIASEQSVPTVQVLVA